MMKKGKMRFFAGLLAATLLFSAMPVSAEQAGGKSVDGTTEQTERAVDAAGASVPADALRWSGHYYKLYSTKMTAADADAYCKSLGGYLATITSDKERETVAGLIGNLSSHDAFYFIGGRTGDFDAQNGMGFSKTGAHWDTGEEDTVNYWRGNTYADYCEKQDSAYRKFGWCGEYYNTPLYRPAGYYWDVVSRGEAEETYGFICEWGDRVNIDDAACTLESSYMIYNGTAKTPALRVEYQGVTLENLHDYTYEYANNLNPGTATVTIRGIGRFQGTAQVNFSVEPKLSLVVKQEEEITNIYCTPAELPIADSNYLKTFLSGIRLELSKEDQAKVKGMSNSFGISSDGKNAVWQTSLTGAVDGSIDIRAVTGGGQSVEAKKTGVKPAFDVNRYRADDLLNNKNNLESMEYFVTMESPSAILVKNAEADKLGTATAFWNLLTTIGDGAGNAGKALDLPFKEKEMYQAILIDIFEQSMENDMIANADKFASRARSALKTATSLSGNIDTLETYVFFLNTGETYESMWKEDINYAAEDAASIINKSLELLELDKYNVSADNVSDILGAASTAQEAVSAAWEYLEYIIACNQMSVMSEDMQAILKEMYTASASNPQMRLALRELSAMVSDCTGTILTKSSLMAGKKLTQTLIKSFWKDVKKAAGPTVNGYLAAYKAGKLVADKLYGAEKTAEAFVRMKAVLEIEGLVKSIYNKEKARYKQSREPEDAALYLAATEVIFYALDTDCKYAIEFCDAVDGAWMSKVLGWFDLNDAEALKKSVTSIRASAKSKADQVAVDWVYQLRSDYPSQYEEYKSILEKREASAHYEVHCPVNVEIYQASGKIAASVVDHKAFWDGESDLVISAAGDGAEIWFYGNADFFNIRYTGTGDGSMDVVIQKFDEAGNQTQKVQYNQVPLAAGSVYESNENLNDATGSYALSDKNDTWNTVDPDVDTASPVKAKRRVTVKNGYLLYDVQEGSANTAECYPGETVFVYTALKTDLDFTGWKDASGTIVFSDKTDMAASFVMPDADVEIEAVYGKTDTSSGTGTQKPGGSNPQNPKPGSSTTQKPGSGQTATTPVLPKAGTKLTDPKTKMGYVVAARGKSVLFSKPKSKKVTKLTVPATVKLKGISYTVVGIADNALSGCGKLKTVSIGKHVQSIGAKAFYNCKALAKITIPAKVAKIGKQAFGGCGKLKNIVIKTEKLTKKSVGANAFRGIHKNATIKTPKKKKSSYKKILRARGVGKKVKIK